MKNHLFNIIAVPVLTAIPLPLFCLPNVSAAESVFENATSVQWLGTPLRESLEQFCETQRIYFFLDRRIDPAQPVQLEATNQTVRQVFAELTEKTDTGCYFFEDTGVNTVYIGTKESAELLPFLLEKHRKKLSELPVRQKNILNRKTAFSLPFLGEPKQAITALIKNNGFSLTETDELLFDIWNKTDLPALPFYKLLALLLIGFEKDYEIDGNTLRIVPLPDLQTLKNELPVLKQETAGTKTQSAAATKVPLSQRRFTLKVEKQPLGTVLDVLSKRLGLKIEVDWKPLEAKQISPEQLISFEVKNATLSELLRAICKPLKLEYRITGETAVIR